MSNVLTINNLQINKLRKVISVATSINDALRRLDISPKDGRARTALKERCGQYGLIISNRNYKNYTVNDVEKSAKSAICYADIMRAVGLSQHGGNLATIKRLIVENDIDVSHFDTKRAFARNKNIWSIENIFCKDSKYHRPNLRTAVLRFNIMEYKCSHCDNRGTWQGEELQLDLDHINGINNDNRIENLQFLCPNCHRQTKTWGGKNK